MGNIGKWGVALLRLCAPAACGEADSSTGGWGSGDLAADIADAETAIRDLNQARTSHVSLEGLARFLVRAESVASSKIEGLDAGPRRLVEAEAAIAQGGESADRVAVELRPPT